MKHRRPSRLIYIASFNFISLPILHTCIILCTEDDFETRLHVLYSVKVHVVCHLIVKHVQRPTIVML